LPQRRYLYYHMFSIFAIGFLNISSFIFGDACMGRHRRFVPGY